MKTYLRRLPTRVHCAHRGGSAVAPENTLVAFRLAREAWATDVLELDVRLTRDGHVVVIHDETVDRTTNGRGPVATMSLAEVQQLDAGHHHAAFRGQGIRVPTLREVLDAFPGTPINIELKDGSDAALDAFADVVTRAGAVERVCIGHVDESRAELLLRRLPNAAFWYPEAPLTLFVMCCRGGQVPPRDDRWDVLSAPHEYGGVPVLDRALVDAAHGQGKLVHAWTVDDAARMEALLAAGVDGILTDRPDVLRGVMFHHRGPVQTAT